jgi:hypothetical protein
MKKQNMGSIYQGNMREAGAGAGMSLIVEGGRLVNHRPDGMTGIAQVSMARRAMKQEAKIQMAAEGYVRGERMSEMNEMMSSMIGGCSCGKPNCNC